MDTLVSMSYCQPVGAYPTLSYGYSTPLFRDMIWFKCFVVTYLTQLFHVWYIYTYMYHKFKPKCIHHTWILCVKQKPTCLGWFDDSSTKDLVSLPPHNALIPCHHRDDMTWPCWVFSKEPLPILFPIRTYKWSYKPTFFTLMTGPTLAIKYMRI